MRNLAGNDESAVGVGAVQRDVRIAKRPALSLGVDLQGHRSARTERGEQQLMRRRAGVVAALVRLLIRAQPMRADLNVLSELPLGPRTLTSRISESYRDWDDPLTFVDGTDPIDFVESTGCKMLPGTSPDSVLSKNGSVPDSTFRQKTGLPIQHFARISRLWCRWALSCRTSNTRRGSCFASRSSPPPRCSRWPSAWASTPWPSAWSTGCCSRDRRPAVQTASAASPPRRGRSGANASIPEFERFGDATKGAATVAAEGRSTIAWRHDGTHRNRLGAVRVAELLFDGAPAAASPARSQVQRRGADAPVAMIGERFWREKLDSARSPA